jgi:hypothetical protein
MNYTIRKCYLEGTLMKRYCGVLTPIYIRKLINDMKYIMIFY